MKRLVVLWVSVALVAGFAPRVAAAAAAKSKPAAKAEPAKAKPKEGDPKKEEEERRRGKHQFLVTLGEELKKVLPPAAKARLAKIDPSGTGLADPQDLAYLAIDRFVRIIAPVALAAAQRDDVLKELKDLPEIKDEAAASSIFTTVDKAGKDVDRDTQNATTKEAQRALAAVTKVAKASGLALQAVLAGHPEDSAREVAAGVRKALEAIPLTKPLGMERESEKNVDKGMKDALAKVADAAVDMYKDAVAKGKEKPKKDDDDRK